MLRIRLVHFHFQAGTSSLEQSRFISTKLHLSQTEDERFHQVQGTESLGEKEEEQGSTQTQDPHY